jgi:hypothetical protein
MVRDAAKLVSAYERGILTDSETVGRLIELGASTAPADIAPDLPAEWLTELRRQCEKFFPCPAPGGILRISSVCNGPGYDAERVRKEWEDRWRAGLVAWQVFFGIDSTSSITSAAP